MNVPPTGRLIDACLSVRAGRLYMDEVPLDAIARDFGTPVYVASESQLRRNVRAYSEGLARCWPEGPTRILASLKANSVLALRQILNEEGAGCDTIGLSELEIALRSGLDPELISLNGAGKDRVLINRAVMAGVKIVVDNDQELQYVEEAAERQRKPAIVRFRMKPYMPEMTEPADLLVEETPIWRFAQASKTGFPTEQLIAAGRRAIENPLLDVRGLHMHAGRLQHTVETHRALARSAVAILAELHVAWDGWTPRELDLGGGYAVPRDPVGRILARNSPRPPDDRAPSPSKYMKSITETLRVELHRAGITAEGLAIEIEPGRSIYGDTTVHLATVIQVKTQNEPLPYTWVSLDTTEHFLLHVPSEFGVRRFLVATRPDAEPDETADLVGIGCLLDRIVGGARIPHLGPGDIVALLDAGAYDEARSCNFNSLPRPGTVLVSEDRVEWIRRAETLEDVVRRDIARESSPLVKSGIE